MNTRETNDTELGFKYHTHEFLDVSQELRQVGHIGRIAKNQPGLVREFYDALEYLDEIYSEYFDKEKEIQEIFTKCEKKLNDENYKNNLNKYEEGKISLKNNILNYEIKIIKDLKKAFRYMSSGLVKSELRPRPNKVVHDEYPDIEDPVTKEILKGVNSIIKR